MDLFSLIDFAWINFRELIECKFCKWINCRDCSNYDKKYFLVKGILLQKNVTCYCFYMLPYSTAIAMNIRNNFLLPETAMQNFLAFFLKKSIFPP